jgi:hypothetical protein
LLGLGSWEYDRNWEYDALTMGVMIRTEEVGRILKDLVEQEIEDLEALRRTEVAIRGVAIVNVVVLKEF